MDSCRKRIQLCSFMVQLGHMSLLRLDLIIVDEFKSPNGRLNSRINVLHGTAESSGLVKRFHGGLT